MTLGKDAHLVVRPQQKVTAVPVALPLRGDGGGGDGVGRGGVVLLLPLVSPESDGGGCVGAALQVITAIPDIAASDPMGLLLVLMMQHDGSEMDGRSRES